MIDWSWVFTKQAEKEFDALDKKTQRKLVEQLDLLAQHSPGCEITTVKSKENMWRLKVGHWRVFFTKDKKVHEITVVKIARRTTTTYS